MIKEKLRLLHGFCAKEGLNLLDYFVRYRGRFFSGTSLDKFKLFRGLLTNSLNEEEFSYVNKMLNIKHRDKRSASEYGSELVLGWLIEDVIADVFSLELSGSDSDREFLPTGKISNLTDFKLLERPVELMVDWGSYWVDLGRIHFRHDKLKKLVDSNAIVLGFSILCNKFFVMDLKKGVRYRKEYNPRQGKYCDLIDGYDNFLDMCDAKAALKSLNESLAPCPVKRQETATYG
jgi:hypothetical protein